MKTSPRPSPILSAGPAAVLIALYVIARTLSPPAELAQIARLEQDVQTLRNQQMPISLVEEMEGKVEWTTKQLKDVEQEVEQLSTQAKQWVRKSVGTLDAMSHVRQLGRLMMGSGLMVVSETVESNSTNAQLVNSLNQSASELSATLKQVANTQSPTNPALPPNLPGELSPLEFLAEQQRNNRRQFDVVPRSGMKLVLVGNYESMLRGLQAVNRECPEVLITGVAFERPEQMPANWRPLIWTVQVLLHPSIAPESTNPKNSPASNIVLNTEETSPPTPVAVMQTAP